MDFIQLNITAIRQSNSQNNAYVLLLNETVGKRQLPIVIGWCEARSIAIALDGTEKPSRPLTHDLFKTLGDSFDITVQKVVVHTLIEGVFHSAFHCKNKATGEEVKIDARTSRLARLKSFTTSIGINVNDKSFQSDKKDDDESEKEDDIENRDFYSVPWNLNANYSLNYNKGHQSSDFADTTQSLSLIHI